MFPRAHTILFVIICNGWFGKDVIQTGISDYIDYRQDAQSKDYMNILPNNFKALPNSKLPPPKQKETLGEFTKRAKPRFIVNPTEQISKNSIQAKPSPKANPRFMVNPSEQISKNSVQAKPSPKANPRFMVNPSEQMSTNILPANPLFYKQEKQFSKEDPRFLVDPSEQMSTNSLPANPLFSKQEKQSSKAKPRFMVNPSEQISGNSMQINPSPKLFSKDKKNERSKMKSNQSGHRQMSNAQEVYDKPPTEIERSVEDNVEVNDETTEAVFTEETAEANNNETNGEEIDVDVQENDSNDKLEDSGEENEEKTEDSRPSAEGGCEVDNDCEEGKTCSLNQDGLRSGKFKKFNKKAFEEPVKGVCITGGAPRQISQNSTNSVPFLSPVTVANTEIVTRKPLTDAEKIMSNPMLNAIDTCCRNNFVPISCSPLCNITYAEKVLDESWDWGEYKKTCKKHKKKIGICHIGGKHLNATEDEHKDLANKARSLLKTNGAVSGRQLSGDENSPELKLQGVLLSDNGTVHIPDNPVIKGPTIDMANHDNHALITTKNQSSSQASKTSKIDGMRVKSKARAMTQDLEEKCSDDDKECKKRADFMKNDDQETESDTIESSNEMKIEYETEEENAEGDAVEEEDDDNDEEEEEGSGEEEEEEEDEEENDEEEEEEEIEEGHDESSPDEETPEEDPNYEDETEDGNQDDDGASQEGVPLDDNYEDDSTGTTPNAIKKPPRKLKYNDTLSVIPSQNVSSAIRPREFVPVAKPVPPMKGSVIQSSRISPIITPKGTMHHHARVIVNNGVAKPYVVGTANGIPVPVVSNPVIPPAKGSIVPNPIPPPLVIPPVIPPSPPHMHFGQRFGGHYADGGLMGPGNWQARNWFSIGSLRKDGVRLNGACCGNTCRNGGRIGCCGKCPNCLDCPY